MPEVQESILLSIKKLNNVAADYTAFDDDFVMYINSALSDLHQVGIGPSGGYFITDADQTWDEFFDPEDPLHQIKTFIGLRVRLFFDPPVSSFAIGMMEKQLDEQLNRLKYAQTDIEAEEEVV